MSIRSRIVSYGTGSKFCSHTGALGERIENRTNEPSILLKTKIVDFDGSLRTQQAIETKRVIPVYPSMLMKISMLIIFRYSKWAKRALIHEIGWSDMYGGEGRELGREGKEKCSNEAVKYLKINSFTFGSRGKPSGV